MMEKKVSIIVPVYNAKEYLERCLESIVGQTYDNIELLLVDDGSKDESGAICDAYAAKYNFIKVIHQKNQGQSAARNHALDIASGEYILFVDADDYIDVQLVEKAVSASVEHDAEVVLFEHNEIQQDGLHKFVHNFQKDKINLNAISYEEVYKLILLDDLSNLVWNKLYRRKIWEKLRFQEGYYYEDLSIHPVLFAGVKSLFFLEEALYYNNRVNENSTTSKKNDFNAFHRYCKFLAYREHEKYAKSLGLEQIAAWAVKQAQIDAIKALYINYKCEKKITMEQKSVILDYLREHDNVGLSSKLSTLKSSALGSGVLLHFYGIIRAAQESIRHG